MIHHTFANRSNIGDWLSARGIQSLLSPEPIVEHRCDAPFVAETARALSALSGEDSVVIGGGGLLMDYFDPFWESLAAIPQNVPIFLWGIGYCDTKRKCSHPSQSILTPLLKRSRLCVVRDELTREHLRDSCRVEVAPCPTFSAVSPVPAAHRGLLHVDAYDNVGPDVYETMVATLKNLADQTGRPYSQTNNLIESGNESQLQTTLEQYSRADIVVSSRLHGCIVALAMGRPVLAVSGDRKVESFMESAGLADWVLDLDEMDLLAERVRELPAQPDRSHYALDARRAHHHVAARVRSIHCRTKTPTT